MLPSGLSFWVRIFRLVYFLIQVSQRCYANFGKNKSSDSCLNLSFECPLSTPSWIQKYKSYCLCKMKKAFHSTLIKGTSVSAACLLLKIVGWLFFRRKCIWSNELTCIMNWHASWIDMRHEWTCIMDHASYTGLKVQATFITCISLPKQDVTSFSKLIQNEMLIASCLLPCLALPCKQDVNCLALPCKQDVNRLASYRNKMNW